MQTMLSVFLSVFLFTAVSAQAGEKVAKVIILKAKKGEVKSIDKGGKEADVELNQWLEEGMRIKTSPKCFVKLLFIDKSQMNLGPDSEMEIQVFPKQEAGIINLVKGQLRSKVTKDYMDIKDKDKSKLFIKTKTAAMGVRGTDFSVTVDTAQATKLDVFEGKVAMAPIDPNIPVTSVNLEAAVSSSAAAMVTQGVSGTLAPNAPTSAPPKTEQIPESKMQESSKTDLPGSGIVKRDVTPPGVSKTEFSNVKAPVSLAAAGDSTAPAPAVAQAPEAKASDVTRIPEAPAKASADKAMVTSAETASDGGAPKGRAPGSVDKGAANSSAAGGTEKGADRAPASMGEVKPPPPPPSMNMHMQQPIILPPPVPPAVIDTNAGGAAAAGTTSKVNFDIKTN